MSIDFSEFDRVLILDEPIKGKISLPLDNNQASDSWGIVIFFSAAIIFSLSTNSKFLFIFSS